MGRVEPGPRPAPDALDALPRRGPGGGLPVHRARTLRLPAHGPRRHPRRAREAWAHAHRRHRVRRPPQGQGRARAGEGRLRRGDGHHRPARRPPPRDPARGIHGLPGQPHRQPVPDRRRVDGADEPGCPSSAGTSPTRTAPCSCSTPTRTATWARRRRSSASSTRTDPEAVHLCLDTGHVAYCGADNLAIIRDHGRRIRYVHLKQVDPAIRGASGRRAARVRAGGPPRRRWSSRRSETRTCRPCWRRSGRSTGSCSASSSRTCTRATRTSRCRSPPARASTSRPAGSTSGGSPGAAPQRGGRP